MGVPVYTDALHHNICQVQLSPIATAKDWERIGMIKKARDNYQGAVDALERAVRAVSSAIVPIAGVLGAVRVGNLPRSLSV